MTVRAFHNGGVVLSPTKADCYHHGTDLGTTGHRMNNPPRGFPRSLAQLTGATLSEALKKQGFASSELVARWSEIAGRDIAAHSEPIKINWPRVVQGDAPPEPATLVLRAEGPAALEIQHQSAVILERVNRFFGWAAVGRIALRQAPLKRHAPPPSPPAPDAVAAARIAADLPIADEDLRAALGRLGAAVKQK